MVETSNFDGASAEKPRASVDGVGFGSEYYGNKTIKNPVNSNSCMNMFTSSVDVSKCVSGQVLAKSAKSSKSIIPSVQPASPVGISPGGRSASSDKVIVSRRKYKRKQYTKKKKMLQNQEKVVLNTEKMSKKVKAKHEKTQKEILQQYRYRERLRKIYSALEANEVPSVPVELSDKTSVPVGLTIEDDRLIVAPGTTVYKSLVPIDPSEVDMGTYTVEGLGQNSLCSVGDGIMAKRIIRGVQISNWTFDKDWIIEKGDQIAVARIVSWEKLPSLDNIFSNEKEFIVNNVRAQFPGEEIDPEELFREQHASGMDGASSKTEGVGPDRLPSAKALLAFEKIVKDLESRAPELVETMHKVKSMFIPEDPGEPFQFMNVAPVNLKTKKDAPNFISPLYQKSFTEEEKQCIDQYIEQNLKNQMIEPAPDSRYASPLLVVRKRADPTQPNAPVKRRVIIDSRQVNSKCLEQSVFAAPNMDEAVRRLGGCKFFTVMDIKSAFHRLRLAKESRDLTAFIYNGTGQFAGVYRYRNLAQGCQESPRLFVNALREALGPVFKDMRIAFWIDDGLIGSETYKQHIVDVSKFLHAAWKANVKLDIEKCDFVVPEVDWCSYRFGNGEVRPSPDRLTCLDNLKYPEIRRNKPPSRAYMRIHGLLNYFRRFVPKFSEHLSKMRDFVKQAWDDSHETTFQHAQTECDKHVSEIVKSIRTQSLLVVPDGSDLICFTDASSISFSYCVTRASDRRPIAFGGKSFNEVQRKYGSLDRELLGVKLLLEKAGCLLSTAKSVIIRSDNLTSILQFHGAHNEITARTLRLLLEISARKGPQIKFEFLEGAKNVVADALSRLKFNVENIPENPQGDDLRKVNFLQSVDEPVFDFVNGYHVCAVSTRSRNSLKKKLELMHSETHSGYQKLLKSAKAVGLTGPGLRQMCIEVTQSCSFCYNEKRLLADNFLGTTETPDAEMRTIYIDHMYLPTTANGNSFALTLLDPFSKFLMAVPLPTLEMESVRTVLQVYFTVFSSIHRCRGDNAFNACTIADLCDIFGVELKFFASHNSRSNNVERSHSTLRQLIESFLKERKLDDDEWDKVLHLCVKAHNSTMHHTTRQIPHAVVFNQNPSFAGVDFPVEPTVAERRKQIYSRITTSKAKYASPQREIPRLSPGTEVTVRYSSKAKPLKGVIVEDDGGLVAVVRREHRANQHKTIRVSKRHIWIPMNSLNVCAERSIV